MCEYFAPALPHITLPVICPFASTQSGNEAGQRCYPPSDDRPRFDSDFELCFQLGGCPLDGV